MSTLRPLIAFVGRPNVGKSTLFNRIVGRRAAIVQDVPGVTRDRNYGDFTWEHRLLSAVDTGGFDPVSPARKDESSDRTLMRSVQEQAQLAVDEAAAVVLVVDGREGPTGVDRAIADLLRPSRKLLFVAVNKMDTPGTEVESPLAEFYELGFGDIHPVSAEHGRGVGELMEAVLAGLAAGEARRRRRRSPPRSRRRWSARRTRRSPPGGAGAGRSGSPSSGVPTWGRARS